MEIGSQSCSEALIVKASNIRIIAFADVGKTKWTLILIL
jgi:hypothetical protein